MGELVGIDDRTDGVARAVGDFEREQVDQAPLGVERQAGRLAVDLGPDELRTELGIAREELQQQAVDVLFGVDRLGQSAALPAAVAVEDDVGGEELDQVGDLAVLGGVEEFARERLLLLAVTLWRVPPSSMRRWARTKIWRQFASFLWTISAISS